MIIKTYIFSTPKLPQEGKLPVYGATGTSTTEQLLWAKMANSVALQEGAVTAETMEDRDVVGQIKGLVLNLVALLRDILYQLQVRATTKLHTREGHVVQMLSEQRINIE